MKGIKYDGEKIRKMLKEGYSDGEIADEVGGTRANVNLKRQELIKKGIINKPDRGRPVTTRRKDSRDNAPDFDQVMQFVIEAVAAKQREPELKAELEKYKRGYQNMKEHAEAMEKAAKERINWEQQYRLAVQKGDLPKI